MSVSVILYGAGKRCENLCRILRYSDIEILAIIDSSSQKWGMEVAGYRIESPEILRKLETLKDAIFCITVADSNAQKKIRGRLWAVYQYLVPQEIDYFSLVIMSYKRNSTIGQTITHYKSDRGKEESILFDCYNGLGLGGVEAWTMDLCKAMIGAGRSSTYIISNTGTYDVPPELAGHILYTDIDGFSQSSIRNLVDLILDHMPCQVVTCTADAVMVAAYLVKEACPNMIKIISVIHNDRESVYRDQLSVRERIDAYAAVSQDIRNEMIQRGATPEKVYSITCPFPCEETLDRTYTENISLPVRIGYAGRMDGLEHSQKRMDLLLKLADRLKVLGVSFRLELAGGGVAWQSMEEFVGLHQLEDRVRFLGCLPRSELSQFWKSIDICVNLADYEGRSLSIIEAMGNGTVPVVTATSGVREDITDGVNGYIVPLGDYQLMAERIAYLAEHRERLPEMGRQAHNIVYPKSLMGPHLEFWKELLADRH